jgi:hypothetical protein
MAGYVSRAGGKGVLGGGKRTASSKAVRRGASGTKGARPSRTGRGSFSAVPRGVSNNASAVARMTGKALRFPNQGGN